MRRFDCIGRRRQRQPWWQPQYKHRPNRWGTAYQSSIFSAALTSTVDTGLAHSGHRYWHCALQAGQRHAVRPQQARLLPHPHRYFLFWSSGGSDRLLAVPLSRGWQALFLVREGCPMCLHRAVCCHHRHRRFLFHGGLIGLLYKLMELLEHIHLLGLYGLCIKVDVHRHCNDTYKYTSHTPEGNTLQHHRMHVAILLNVNQGHRVPL